MNFRFTFFFKLFFGEGMLGKGWGAWRRIRNEMIKIRGFIRERIILDFE